MANLRRLARRCAAALCGLLGLLLVLAASLRGDKTEVFYRVRGEYAGARTLAEWRLGEARCRWIALRNDRGEAVATAYVRTPPATVGTPRILLTYTGVKTGKAILELIPQRPDLVLVAVQYPYQRPRGLVAHLRWPHDVRRAAFRTVAGGMLAVSFLAETEGLPTDRLTVLGASVGTPFAVIHGALDRRVAGVVVVHGGGDLPATVWAIERRGGRPWRAPLTWGLAALLADSFDPVRYAGRIAPRPLTIVASRRDRFFPVGSVEALFASAGEPKSLLWTDTEHVGTRKTAVVADIVRVLEAHLAGAPRLAELVPGEATGRPVGDRHDTLDPQGPSVAQGGLRGGRVHRRGDRPVERQRGLRRRRRAGGDDRAPGGGGHGEAPRPRLPGDRASARGAA